MNIYTKKQKWKYALFSIAVLISSLSLYLTNSLQNSLEESLNSLSQSIKTLKQNEDILKVEEENNMKNFATAMQVLNNMTIHDEGDYSMASELIQQNNTIPVILIDECDEIIKHRNIQLPNDIAQVEEKRTEFLKKKLEEMKSIGDSIYIDVFEQKQKLFYKNSAILDKTSQMHKFTLEKQNFTKKLIAEMRWYPYYQITFIILFALFGYFIFNAARRSEQNQVWAGMAKETAHQIATPLSSLIAWKELIKEKIDDKIMINEIEKDISRLETITERFSKIGSKPELREENLISLINNSISYMKTRFSKNIVFNTSIKLKNNNIYINKLLIEWVLENICRNSADSMKGKGKIDVNVYDDKNHTYINISDTGKGINKNILKNIFKPGVTSKKRGWGLGLSLSKRIIEEYHNGKIFVLKSEENVGTTFSIKLIKHPS